MPVVRPIVALCAFSVCVLGVSQLHANDALDFWRQEWQRQQAAPQPPARSSWTGRTWNGGSTNGSGWNGGGWNGGGWGNPFQGGSWGGPPGGGWGSPPPDSRSGSRITVTPRRDTRDPEETKSAGSGERSLCVRTCDGYYFPLPATVDGKDGERACNALCPGAETALFRASGDDIGEATSLAGKTYSSLANAFLYRTKRVASCGCKRPPLRGLAALQFDDTLQRGDIVVTETGVQVFTGRGKAPWKAADFTPYRKARGLSRKTKAYLAEIDRPYTDPPERIVSIERLRARAERGKPRIMAQEIETTETEAKTSRAETTGTVKTGAAETTGSGAGSGR